MKRKPKLTKRERKAQNGNPGRPAQHQHAHIHCVACGLHLEPTQFDGISPTATRVRCQHGSMFASCTDCVPRTRELLAEHDRTGQPVRVASAWH